MRINCDPIWGAFAFSIVLHVALVGYGYESDHALLKPTNASTVVTATLKKRTATSDKLTASFLSEALSLSGQIGPDDILSPNEDEMLGPQRKEQFDQDAGEYVPSYLLDAPVVVIEDHSEQLGSEIADGVEGVIYLSLWVDESGRVAKVTEDDSSLPEGEIRRVVDAFDDIRFLPARIAGRPTRFVIRVSVQVTAAAG